MRNIVLVVLDPSRVTEFIWIALAMFYFAVGHFRPAHQSQTAAFLDVP